MTSRSNIALGALLAALCLCSCTTSVDQDHACELGVQRSSVQAVDRKLLGAGAPYPADFSLRARAFEMQHSMHARRQVAWDTVMRVLEPVPLAETLPQLPDGIPASVPRWHTWYGRDDVSRLFHHLYQNLGPEGRAERERFTDSALADALGWNVDVVDGLPNWPEERWQEYLAAIDSDTEVAGVGGIGRVGYSPAAVRHLLASYPEMLQCEYAGAPAPFVAGSGPGTRRVVTEPVRLQACGSQSFGPFYVAEGETLQAQILGTDGAPVAGALVIADGVEGAEGSCRASGGDTCTVSGPGAFRVAVSSDRRAVADAQLTVDYQEAQPLWSPCLDGAFAGDTVLVKADWRRAQLGFQLPVYDTSEGGMIERMRTGEFDWGTGEGVADPGPEDIYTVQLNNGNIFRLAGLHLMTKELDHWLWVTLWWSPEPDGDFGADRPAGVGALGGPWRNYKMCVSTGFRELDSDPGAVYDDLAPSLARALRVVHEGPGAPSWCSNPYLEAGAGNAATNCVGCHQHGGTGMDVAEVLTDPHSYPAHGRTQVRNNFPADYSWAVDSGDRLGRMFADVVEYYDAFE